jgi:serine/threonine-protein kinase
VDAKNLVGSTLDNRYEVTRVIGAGGMGAVYEATHTGTGRRVAVKVISTGDVTRDAGLVGRFQREAKAAGAIATQHICQVLDTGTDSATGWPYMVMEFMEGEDVQHLVRRLGIVSPELALRIVAQSCIGLAKAHGVGVVHRDIKPANLFL